MFGVCMYAFYKVLLLLKNCYYKKGYIKLFRFVSMPFLT